MSLTPESEPKSRDPHGIDLLVGHTIHIPGSCQHFKIMHPTWVVPVVPAPEPPRETPRQYGERDAEALGAHYVRHVQAMIREGLHSKADIAAELAWRDKEISRMRFWMRRAYDIVEIYARNHPKWYSLDHGHQDPMEAHALCAEYDREPKQDE